MVIYGKKFQAICTRAYSYSYPTSYHSLVHTNYELQQVCSDLEREIPSLQHQTNTRYGMKTLHSVGTVLFPFQVMVLERINYMHQKVTITAIASATNRADTHLDITL